MNEQENQTAAIDRRPPVMDDMRRWDLILAQSSAVARSGVFGSVTTEEVAVRALAGQDLGLSVMQSMRIVYSFKSKSGQCHVGLMSHGMLGLVMKNIPRTKVEIVKDGTDGIAIYRLSHLDGLREPVTMPYTIAEARKAHLIKDGGAWQTSEAAMLRARAKSLACREYAPDVLFGLYSIEELTDDITLDGRDVVVTDPRTGEILNASGKTASSGSHEEIPIKPPSVPISPKQKAMIEGLIASRNISRDDFKVAMGVESMTFLGQDRFEAALQWIKENGGEPEVEDKAGQKKAPAKSSKKADKEKAEPVEKEPESGEELTLSNPSASASGADAAEGEPTEADFDRPEKKKILADMKRLRDEISAISPMTEDFATFADRISALEGVPDLWYFKVETLRELLEAEKENRDRIFNKTIGIEE